MLLMAGDADDIVFVKNTNNLYDRVIAGGGKVQKVIYPGMDHIKIIALMSSRLPGHAELIRHVSDFVQGVTGPMEQGTAARP